MFRFGALAPPCRAGTMPCLLCRAACSSLRLLAAGPAGWSLTMRCAPPAWPPPCRAPAWRGGRTLTMRGLKTSGGLGLCYWVAAAPAVAHGARPLHAGAQPWWLFKVGSACVVCHSRLHTLLHATRALAPLLHRWHALCSALTGVHLQLAWQRGAAQQAAEDPLAAGRLPLILGSSVDCC